MEIIKYVLLGFDILIIVLLLLRLLSGFRKGTIRSAIILATQLVPLIILFAFSGLIAKKVVNSNINIEGTDTTILEFAQSLLPEEMIDTLNGINASSMINDVLISGVKLILCIAFAIITFLIISPLIRFILFLALPGLRKKKPKLGSRLGGMGIRFAGSLILFWLFALPIYGSLEVANVASQTIAQAEVQVDDSTIEDSLSGSFILKMTSAIGKKKNGAFGFGAKRLGQVLQIKVDKTKINLIKEIDGIIPMIPRVMELNQIYSKENNIQDLILALNEQDIDNIFNVLSNSSIIKLAWPIAVSYLKQAEESSEFIGKMQLDYDKLASIDISENFTATATLLKETLKFAKANDLTKLDMSILESDENINQIITILNSAYNIKLFEEIFPKAIYALLSEKMSTTEYAFILDFITPAYLKNDLPSDVSNIAKIYVSLKEAKIFDYFLQKEGTYTFDDDTKKLLDTAKDLLLNIQLLKNNYGKLLENVDQFIPDDIPLDFSNVSSESVDWKVEFGLLFDFITTGYKLMVNTNFDSNDPMAILDNENTPTYIAEMINIILESQLADKYYLPAFEDLINQYTTGTDFEKYQSYFDIAYLKDGLVDDIQSIAKLYKIYKELELNRLFDEDPDFSIGLEDEAIKTKFTTFINDLLNLKVINNHESELLTDLLDLSGLNEYIEIDTSNPNIDWTAEKQILSQIIVSIFDLTDLKEMLDSQENLDILAHKASIIKVAEVLDLMTKSNLTKNTVFDLLNKVFETAEYNISLDENDKAAIINNTFKQEITILLELLESSNELFEKNQDGNLVLDETSSATIVNLMKKASTSVIATKIIGQVINDNLGQDGLNILPLDETGQPVYDFSNPNTLKDNADSVGVLIDLYVTLHNIDTSNLTDNDIDSLKNCLDEMGQTGLNQELIDAFLNTILENDNIDAPADVDWQQESQTLTDVLNAYQESSDKDNFTIDDPDLLEAVNQSDVAKSILEYLNII